MDNDGVKEVVFTVRRFPTIQLLLSPRSDATITCISCKCATLARRIIADSTKT